VAVHSFGPWAIDSFGEKVLATVISGGSTLFVFISGFFFHHVFYNNFRYKEFMIKKAKNVLFPYLILSMSGICYYLASSDPLPYANKLGVTNPVSWLNYIEVVSVYLWTGRIVAAYWYIPFVMIIFSMSPFFIRYINCSVANRIYIFLVLLLVAMVVQRPQGNLSPLHSVIYFTPIYMLGINCSIHREVMNEYIKGKSIFLGFLVLYLSVLQALFFEGYGNFNKATIFSFQGIDISIIQKISLCFLLLSILQIYEGCNIPFLKLMASRSFAIYFIHPWILKLIHDTGLQSFLSPIPGMGVFLITALLLVICSLLVSYMVKLGLKNNSRYIIGW
jgi:hypothetical protein